MVPRRACLCLLPVFSFVRRASVFLGGLCARCSWGKLGRGQNGVSGWRGLLASALLFLQVLTAHCPPVSNADEG